MFNMGRKLLQILIMSGVLATWELFLKDMWANYVTSSGHSLGFGETMLGYFMVMTVGYLLGVIITRRYESGAD